MSQSVRQRGTAGLRRRNRNEVPPSSSGLQREFDKGIRPIAIKVKDPHAVFERQYLPNILRGGFVRLSCTLAVLEDDERAPSPQGAGSPPQYTQLATLHVNLDKRYRQVGRDGRIQALDDFMNWLYALVSSAEITTPQTANRRTCLDKDKIRSTVKIRGGGFAYHNAGKSRRSSWANSGSGSNAIWRP